MKINDSQPLIKPKTWSIIKFLAIIGVILFLMDQCFKVNKDQSDYEANDPQGRIERHFSNFDGSYTKFRNYIKDNLNNPSSFEHVETRYTDNNDGTVKVIMKYRGENAFGAILTKYAKCTLNISTGDFSDVVVE
ncbi:hypothetical protein ACF3OC_08355 [Sphingobacterium cellulitidis]|uniref:hypothetical protein n=1 Tax=Sphingobacterium cellulitidis TaxID=1768011 RepID=UPI00370D0009